MKSHTFLGVFAGILLTAATAPAAVTFTTVGIYDENTTQANAVDTNASGNSLASLLTTDVAGFKPLIAAEFTNGTGGVINFDLPNGSNANLTSGAAETIAASYAGGTKTLNITPATNNTGGNFNYTTFTSLTPISDSRGMIPTGSGHSSATRQRMTFDSITGGDALEGVTQVGFTVLSRAIGAQTVTAWAFTNGLTNTVDAFASLSTTISNTNGGDDTFFSFIAPTNKTITGVLIQYGTATSGDTRYALDDFAFITAIVVPEPASLTALAAGLGLMALCRR